MTGQTELHRIELLEAEVRQLRQSLRNLATAVIAGDEQVEEMAQAGLEMIE